MARDNTTEIVTGVCGAAPLARCPKSFALVFSRISSIVAHARSQARVTNFVLLLFYIFVYAILLVRPKNISNSLCSSVYICIHLYGRIKKMPIQSFRLLVFFAIETKSTCSPAQCKYQFILFMIETGDVHFCFPSTFRPRTHESIQNLLCATRSARLVHRTPAERVNKFTTDAVARAAAPAARKASTPWPRRNNGLIGRCLLP